MSLRSCGLRCRSLRTDLLLLQAQSQAVACDKSTCRANQFYQLARLVPARGAYRDRHERGMGCGGRESAGAQMESQGKLSCERNSARRTKGAEAYGKTVWSRHPWLVPSCRWRI